MRLIILILTVVISPTAYSQIDLPYIGRQILASDSVIVYSSPATVTIKLSDSVCCNMTVLRDSLNTRVKLSARAKNELANAFIKPTGFSGRFGSRRGFEPSEIIVIWKKGAPDYLKVSRKTHVILYSKNWSWIFLNPFDVDRIDKFYKKYKIESK
ncbi:MAG TPA: hypothetical protein VMY77_18620 [Chitinophagaceae bacterium]|nr:hypothetical protein [Chitinophagaceae bacterium]